MHDIVHDFAQYLRKNRSNEGVEAANKKTITCELCDTSLVSNVKEYRTLFFDKRCLPDFCDCLRSVRVLIIKRCNVFPRGMENLIHLRRLELIENKLSRQETETICKLYNLQFLWLKSCKLQEIPVEIGNLKYLRHLDLSSNDDLVELPDSICSLQELRTLNVYDCRQLCRLPQGIHRLINLEHIHNFRTVSLTQFPQGLAQLTGLRTLEEFSGGRGWGKLGWLKNLNRLGGSLDLRVKLAEVNLEEVVKDAREAKLREKIHIQTLEIVFQNEKDEKEESSRRINATETVLDALEPHPNLKDLTIRQYKGSKLPGWIASPLNQLRHIELHNFRNLSSLPPLGKLQCLEAIYIAGMERLEFVGREFLGITRIVGGGEGDDMMGIHESSSSSSSSSSVTAAAAANTIIAFPKLKRLTFFNCPKWKEWEDITAEDEESPAVSLMPCLMEFSINSCKSLTALPHRLLQKASSLETASIFDSTELQQRYGDKDSSPWKSISEDEGGFWIHFSKVSSSDH